MVTDNNASREAGSGVAVNGSPPRENIVRALMPGPEFRASKNKGELGTLHGHFAVFSTPTEINSVSEGRFIERIAPGSFKKTFRENRASMKVLFDHGHDPSVGNKPLGPITDLREDDDGAFYEVDLIDTSYNRDLLPGLKADLYGASFRFRVIREDIDKDPERSDVNPDGIPERTIREAQVLEFGPVVFPAYASATAGVRSMTDEHIFKQFLEQPDRLRELLLNFLPAATVEDGQQETAPTENRAEDSPHPVDVRRDTRPLYGLNKEEKPAWRL